MQKLKIGIVGMMLFNLLLPLSVAQAMPAQPIQYLLKTSVDKKVALANGIDEVTLTVRAYIYECSAFVMANAPAVIIQTDNPKRCIDSMTSTIKEVGIDLSKQPTPDRYKMHILLAGATAGAMISPQEFVIGEGGYATIKVKATTPGLRYLNVILNDQSYYVPVLAGDHYNETQSVNFISDPYKADGGTTVVNNTYNITLNSPVIQSMVINGETVSINGNNIIKDIPSGSSPTFSGTAKANSVVNLSFHSDPYSDTTTTDANGNWKYTLTKNLGVGDHTVEVSVSDPNTKEKSPTSSPINFRIAAVKSDASNSSNSLTSETPINNWLIYIVVAVSVFVVILLVFALILYRKKHIQVTNPNKQE